MNEYTVSSAQDRANLIGVIRNLVDEKWTVKIYPWVQKKTTAQNRLLWKWNTEIGEHFGLEPEEMHSFLKEKFLLSILYRDDPSFARMADSIRNVKQYSKKRS
jgi:hypothetical protein